MWHSIKEIIEVRSLWEAYKHYKKGCVEYFCGGAYLSIEKSPTIEKLIPIAPFLDSGFSTERGKIIVGAAESLEAFREYFIAKDEMQLSKAAFRCCEVKSIRNQISIGGEIAKANVDSALYIHFYNLNLHLEILREKISYCDLRDWDGDGIITSVQIPPIRNRQIRLDYFAVSRKELPFLIVSTIHDNNVFEFTVGGKCRALNHFQVKAPLTSINIKKIVSESLKNFDADEFGTIAYKGILLQDYLENLEIDS